MAKLLALKRDHQAIKHQMRQMTHVVTILKLPEILRKVLRTNVNARAVDPPFELRPVAFDGGGSSAVVRGVLARVVLNGHVIEAKIIKAAIRTKFIGRDGRDGRAGEYVGLDQGFHRRAMAARDNLSNDLSPRSFMPTTTALLPL